MTREWFLSHLVEMLVAYLLLLGTCVGLLWSACVEYERQGRRRAAWVATLMSVGLTIMHWSLPFIVADRRTP